MSSNCNSGSTVFQKLKLKHSDRFTAKENLQCEQTHKNKELNCNKTKKNKELYCNKTHQSLTALRPTRCKTQVDDTTVLSVGCIAGITSFLIFYSVDHLCLSIKLCYCKVYTTFLLYSSQGSFITKVLQPKD